MGQFWTNKNIVSAAHIFFNSIVENDFQHIFQKWQNLTDKCLTNIGTYFEQDIRWLDDPGEDL